MFNYVCSVLTLLNTYKPAYFASHEHRNSHKPLRSLSRKVFAKLRVQPRIMRNVVANSGRFGKEHLLNKSAVSPCVRVSNERMVWIVRNLLVVLDDQMQAQ